jgi:hypothetical protein
LICVQLLYHLRLEIFLGSKSSDRPTFTYISTAYLTSTITKTLNENGTQKL